MAILLFASSMPLAGKTALIVGLAQNLRQGQRRVTALRLHSGDPLQEGPQMDARLYSLLPFLSDSPGRALSVEQAAEAIPRADSAQIVFTESDSGLSVPDTARALGARVLLVEQYRPEVVQELDRQVGQIGEALAGVIVTKVPERHREDLEAEITTRRLPCFGLLLEDAVLAAFTVGQLQETLSADVLVEGDFDRLVEGIVIGPVSADPGREYFSRFPGCAVITRSHKPDLLLAALDTGIICLVVAGGRPPLEYVIGRAAGDDVPVLLASTNTFETTRALEGVYGSVRFRGQRKIERATELCSKYIDRDALTRALD